MINAINGIIIMITDLIDGILQTVNLDLNAINIKIYDTTVSMYQIVYLALTLTFVYLTVTITFNIFKSIYRKLA